MFFLLEYSGNNLHILDKILKTYMLINNISLIKIIIKRKTTEHEITYYKHFQFYNKVRKEYKQVC